MIIDWFFPSEHHSYLPVQTQIYMWKPAEFLPFPFQNTKPLLKKAMSIVLS